MDGLRFIRNVVNPIMDGFDSIENSEEEIAEEVAAEVTEEGTEEQFDLVEEDESGLFSAMQDIHHFDADVNARETLLYSLFQLSVT